MDSTTLEFLGFMFLSILGLGVFIWIVWVTAGVKDATEEMTEFEKDLKSHHTEIQALRMQVSLNTEYIDKMYKGGKK